MTLDQPLTVLIWDKSLRLPVQVAQGWCLEPKSKRGLAGESLPFANLQLYYSGSRSEMCRGPLENTINGCFRKFWSRVGPGDWERLLLAPVKTCVPELSLSGSVFWPGGRGSERHFLGVWVPPLVNLRADTPPPSVPFCAVRCLLGDEVSRAAVLWSSPLTLKYNCLWHCVLGC